MVEAIASAFAVPAFTKKSAAKPVRAIAGAIARSAADSPLTASGCAVPAFTKKSAARPARAIAGAIAASAQAVATDARRGRDSHLGSRPLLRRRKRRQQTVRPCKRHAVARGKWAVAFFDTQVGDHRAPDTLRSAPGARASVPCAGLTWPPHDATVA